MMGVDELISMILLFPIQHHKRDIKINSVYSHVSLQHICHIYDDNLDKCKHIYHLWKSFFL